MLTISRYLIIITIIFSITPFVNATQVDMKNEFKYDNIIIKTARKHKIDPHLLRAIIWKESNFNPKSVGKAGEVGLMQLMYPVVYEWAQYYNLRAPTKKLLFDPKVNIEIGAWYLAKAMWRWRSYQQYETLALCEYNAGYSNTKYWVPKDFEGPVKINFYSTYNYVTKILIRRNFYKKMNIIKNPINQNNNLTKN